MGDFDVPFSRSILLAVSAFSSRYYRDVARLRSATHSIGKSIDEATGSALFFLLQSCCAQQKDVGLALLKWCAVRIFFAISTLFLSRGVFFLQSVHFLRDITWMLRACDLLLTAL